jgi:hypothetical protein
MGLMDRVKAQATQLAQKTQETARDSKAKFDQAQANRRADALLRNLGAAVYAERTGRGGVDAQTQIDKLIADISAHEAENGISLAQSADQAPGGGPGQASPSFPEAGPTSTLHFPDAGSGSSFPESGGATSFPESGGATSFPESGGATSFPESDPPTS